jgi:hypothetical protein
MVTPPKEIADQELRLLHGRPEVEGLRDVYDGCQWQMRLMVPLVYQSGDFAFVLGGRFHTPIRCLRHFCCYTCEYYGLSWKINHTMPGGLNVSRDT